MEGERGEAARRFHDRTKHSYQSVQHDPHFLDWENQPLSCKLYRGLREIPLPDVSEAGNVSALAGDERAAENAPRAPGAPVRTNGSLQ